MIKHHPENRYERRKLKELHEKKTKFKGKQNLRDEETKDELDSYRSGNLYPD